MVTEGGTAARRRALLQLLRAHPEPITGGELAERFGVSRQVIVQDMAVLRAAGEPLLATPRGYLVHSERGSGQRQAVVAVQHAPEQTEDELRLLVEAGVTVVDVAVEHAVYGELRGGLMIRTPSDVDAFLQRLRASGAGYLSNITQGVHLHTLAAPDDATLERAKAALAGRGYLL